MHPGMRLTPFLLPLVLLMGAVSCSRQQQPSEPSPPAPSETTAPAAGIGGLELRLKDNGGKCQVISEAGSADLQIPWPCGFHRTKEGAIRTKASGEAVIALVESSRPHPKLPGDCLTQVQAIRLLDRRMYPSEHADTVAMCIPFQWDIQMFTGLFDNP